MLEHARKRQWEAVLWKKRRLRGGDTDAPSVTGFAAPTPTRELTILITTFTASEGG